MPDRIQVAACDFDCTMGDTLPWGLEKLRIVGDEYRIPATEDGIDRALKIWGVGLIPLFKNVFPELEEEVETEDGPLRGMIARFIALDADHPPPPLFDGIPETLEILAMQDIRLTVLSNRETMTLMNLLRHHRIDGHFCHVVGGDRAAAHKPHRDALKCTREVVTGLGLDFSRTIMVGDALDDHGVAINNGLRPVIVKTGTIGRMESHPVPSCDLIDTFADLPAWLDDYHAGVH